MGWEIYSRRRRDSPDRHGASQQSRALAVACRANGVRGSALFQFCDDGTLELEQLSTLLTPEVKLFAFTHISNSLGTINPVAELCRKAHAVAHSR